MPDPAAEQQARLCATRAEEAHWWASLAWRDRDIAEAQACSMQEITWRKAQLDWERIARGEPPLPEPLPEVKDVKNELKKRVYKPRPKRGGHWPPPCTVGRY